MKTVLFVQHASAFGGSAMSLIYTLRGIKKDYGKDFKLLVALAKWTQELADFYNKEGFEVVKNDWIDTYEHTQLVSYSMLSPSGIYNELLQQKKINSAKKNTIALLKKVKPDIVHLNSVVLVGSALAVKETKTPLVWHVREPSVKGLFGIRRNKIIKLLKTLPNKSIFICKADKKSWGNPDTGEVVYNFVDFSIFNKNKERPDKIEDIHIPKSDLNILFLGGVAKVKGGLYLIKAFNRILKKYPNKNINFLFPGGLYTKPTYLLYKIATKLLPLLGLGTNAQKIEIEINKSNKKENFYKFKFVKNISDLFLVADVLVFPSIRPHFARPVIEAGAMNIPAIGSELGGVEELIIDTENGFLVKHKNTNSLEEKLSFFIENPSKIQEMGIKGYEIATKKYNVITNVKQIVNIYNKL
uniref:glycosyltransferase n=1 Tax=uncultured Polaribacter sp. TaxID=174711 RepID=UPI00262924F5|nr:glycosyltransferase [uncultured Polaribacter sp.]